MKSLRNHIGALHRNRLPRLLSPELSQPSFPLVPQKVKVGPRHLLGMTAVSGVGLSSVVKMIETVLASAGEVFETTFTKNHVAFSQNGNEHGNA